MLSYWLSIRPDRLDVTDLAQPMQFNRIYESIYLHQVLHVLYLRSIIYTENSDEIRSQRGGIPDRPGEAANLRANKH